MAAVAFAVVALTGSSSAAAAVQAADFQLAPTQVLVSGFAGYGMQFNQHEYAKISVAAGVTDANVPDMEQKVVALQPQFVRLFLDPSEFTQPDRMASFVRSAELAQRAGATINVTWDGGWENYAPLTMTLFASVLADLVENRGVTNLRWATVENEPNTTDIQMSSYRRLYVSLDHQLKRLGLRGQIGLMGGDLVSGTSPLGQTRADWFRFMGTQMQRLLDAYSIHVYWDYRHPEILAKRLFQAKRQVDSLPESGRRTLYVTEYGARGIRSRAGTSYPEPGLYADGTPLEQTNVNAFQHAWLNLLAARLGYAGMSKWDGFFGKYDNGTQDFSMIGPPQAGWPLRPVYYLTRLFTSTIGASWNVVALNGTSGPKLATAYAGPNGELTLVGLDIDGASLNTASPDQISYSIGGLPPNTAFRLLEWNADGTGQTAPVGELRTDGLGVLAVTAPLQSVWAVTTVGA